MKSILLMGARRERQPDRRFGAAIRATRGGGAVVWAIGLLAALIALTAIMSAMGYGPSDLISLSGQRTAARLSTYTVAPKDLLITVTEDGNVESAVNVDVKCQVAGGSSILWIIPDGSNVKAGDKLVELDASSIETEMNSQRITVNKAKSAVIQAEKNYEVAKITVKEYLEGTYLQELETAETNITIAEENLRSAKNSLEYGKKMFQRGYTSRLELESQEFSVKRAQLELNSAETAKRVLEEFTKAKTMEDLQSQVETAQAAMESEHAAYDLELAKLEKLERQIANCVITAPQEGMVVYANDQRGRFGGGDSSTIEEGAAVRDRQTILRLPDLSQMQVKVNVHESKVDDLRRGMRARVSIQGRDLQGNLVSVANQPEQTNFLQANVKEYASIVKIDGTPEELKPGMTAEVEILIANLKDVVALPVASVVEMRGAFYCWVVVPGGEIERRPLVLGLTNDQFVEVKDGVVEGDKVVRNPRAVIGEAQQESTETEDVDVNDKFGEASETTGPFGADGPSGPGRPGQGAGGGDRPGGFGGPPGGMQQGGGRPGGPGGGQSFNLMQFDADGDGKVSKDEAPEPMQGFFDRLDGDGDGFIDQAEIDEMRRRFQSGGAPGGGAPGFGPN